MAPFLASESTSFTLDNMGRFLCNTLPEALDSVGQTVGGRTREFDTIVIGGGTFGCVVAEHLFIADTTRSRRILVLEAGPFVLPEHCKTCLSWAVRRTCAFRGSIIRHSITLGLSSPSVDGR